MLPVETTMAVFPPTFRIGASAVRSPTLWHAVALEMLGVDAFGGNVDAANAWGAAYVLTLTAAEVRAFMDGGKPDLAALEAWVRECRAGVSTVVDGVKAALTAAASTYVPGKGSDSKNLMPHGYGWPLEMAESLAHEYSTGFEDAMDTPMCRAFALMACCRERNGGAAGGPDYYARILIKQIRKAKGRGDSDG